MTTFIHLVHFKTVPVDPFNSYTREAYTEGACGALAEALLDLVGTPIVLTGAHAAVITPTGKILDIEGVHVRSQFERKWGRITHVIMEKNHPEIVHYRANYVESTHSIPVAEKLLNIYGKECGL